MQNNKTHQRRTRGKKNYDIKITDFLHHTSRDKPFFQKNMLIKV